jgi:hypothetical protein
LRVTELAGGVIFAEGMVRATASHQSIADSVVAPCMHAGRNSSRRLCVCMQPGGLVWFKRP